MEKVDECLVEEMKVVVFLVEERGKYLVVELLWWFWRLDFLGLEGLDFLVWEQKYFGQKIQCLTELLQVLVELFQYLD